ncbi:coenzyme PQQ precursor peptide PqqA [Rhodovulum marinum]|nr:coenzyme PQQ precursor peptide PqqA [Rhodovulum marinum]
MAILCPSYGNLKGENIMAWKKPIVREIECGMEINMYGPDSDDHGVLF